VGVRLCEVEEIWWWNGLLRRVVWGTNHPFLSPVNMLAGGNARWPVAGERERDSRERAAVERERARAGEGVGVLGLS